MCWSFPGANFVYNGTSGPYNAIVGIDGTTNVADAAVQSKFYINGAPPPAISTLKGRDSGGDSGIGLADYLLIVLVIPVVVMAIIVALRLMRS